MRLHLRRGQKPNTGFFGGHKGMIFVLHSLVQLTDEEQQLMTTYRTENEVIAWNSDATGQRQPSLRIGDLLRGVSMEALDITTLMNNEEVIKSACENFKVYLEVMKSFGGEEVIDI